MKENITMKITADELKKLLVDYYEKEYNDNNFDIIFETKEECVGLYETKVVQTHIKLKRNIRIGNHIAAIEEELDKDDVNEILTKMLCNTDFEVEYITFDNKKECVGYYEDTEFTFNGLKVDLKRKQKQYRI